MYTVPLVSDVIKAVNHQKTNKLKVYPTNSEKFKEEIQKRKSTVDFLPESPKPILPRELFIDDLAQESES
jgi:hypothetical protein